MFEEAITFDDVYLLPGYNDIASRRDVDLSPGLFGGYKIDLPIISSNMDTVTGPKMARKMIELGGASILHRFCSIEDNVEMFTDVGDDSCGVSIGIGDRALERAQALYDVGARTFCVDVAHGHSKAVGQTIKKMRDLFGRYAYIIAGNVATEAGADYLASCGVDAIKVGIGPGSACTTRIKTGVGVPQITAIMNCRRVDRLIIADGGIRNPGDAAKALAAGADVVMLGGQLAGTDETPGEVMYPGGWDKEMNVPNSKYYDLAALGFHKTFRGMASKEAQEDFMGSMSDWKTSEGVVREVPYIGAVEDVIRDFAGGIRSAFTYVGAENMERFHRKAKFVRVTSAGRAEGEAHSKNV